MAISLVKPPASDANCFLTLAEAEAIVEAFVDQGSWAASTDEQKKAALVEATAKLNGLKWKGVKTDEGNALRFPMSGLYDLDGVLISGIPVFLQSATARTAVKIRTDFVAGTADTVAPTKKLEAGILKIEYDTSEAASQEDSIWDILGLPREAYEQVQPYIRSGADGFELLRA